MMEEKKENIEAQEPEKVAKEAPKQEKKAEKKAEKALKEKVASLEEEKASLEGKLAAEKNDYLKLMAEFETFRRRNTEEKMALVATAAADTIKGLLPVLDDCERAMAMLAESSDEAAKEGTALIYNKLMAYLKTRGLEVIEAKGAKFDTDFHEAVAQFPVPEEDKKGLVFDVVQTGYLLGGKVLRYAKVVVGI
ncbi:MAG: nucleotide exchange factor GrpE [Bacteroidales bacterium]|nr:nucleotide exchange factor GrpE [Bacteroidales bacterium]